MKKPFLIALMLSLCSLLRLGAQDNTYTLKGQILAEETGESLPGAFVLVNGKSGIGAAADAKGQFSLVVSPTDTIVVSMISYETRTIPLEGRKTVTVRLSPSTEYLDQVVVIGYGEQRAKDVTGAISSVDMSSLETMPTHDLSSAMQGRVAGVVMTSADGQPGSEMNVLIRGANSVTQDNSPLYVVDGFPTEDFSMNSLSPEDIKSISILKDASAGAIYGARGANGVIIIETKGGSGDIKVEYSGHVAVHTVSKTMDVMNPYDYVKYLVDLTGSSTYITEDTPLEYYKNVKGRDWQDEMFRAALVHSHSLSVSGSSGKTRYSAGGSYSSQDGVIHNTGYTRAQGRVKLEQDLFKTLTFKGTVNYTYSKTSGAIASEAASTSSSWQSFLMYRLLSASPLKYDVIDDEEGDETVVDISQLNPVISAKNSYRQVANNYVYANASLIWKPIADLKLSAMYGYTANLTDTKVFNNTKTYSGFKNRFNNNGVNGSYGSDDRTGWVMELTANYKAKWAKKHVFSAMATYTMDGNSRSRYEYKSIQIPDENLGISGLETGSPNKLRSYCK